MDIVAPRKKCRFLPPRGLFIYPPCSMDQQEYGSICDYLRKRELPDGLSKNKKDALRRKCKKFVMKEGLLHFHDKKRKVDLQARVATVT